MRHLVSFPALFLICALGGIALIFVGEPHSDEEYYFCAARNVAQGHMPYRDFAFTQAPVSAYVYAISHKLFGPSFYAARATSLLFFMLQLLLVIWVAKRMGGRVAGLFAGATIALNSYAVLFGIQVKTYSLAGLLLTASVAFLVSKLPRTAAVTGSGICLGLATMTRLSAGAAVPVFVAYLLLTERRNLVAMVSGIVACFASMGAVFAPFYLAAPEHATFGFMGVYADLGISSPPLYVFACKISLVTGVFLRYPSAMVMLVMGGALVLYLRKKTSLKKMGLDKPEVSYVALLFLTITLAHLMLLGTSNPQYQMLLVGPMAILAGLAAQTLYNKHGSPEAKRLFTVFLIVLAVLPVWGAAKTIDFSMPVERLKRLSTRIAQMTGPDEKVWSLYSLPVIMADRDVFLEMSMGRYAYRHLWDNEKSDRFRWLSLEKALGHLRDPNTKVALLSDSDFRNLCPSPEPRQRIEAVLHEQYDVVETLRNFQAEVPYLTVYRKRAR